MKKDEEGKKVSLFFVLPFLVSLYSKWFSIFFFFAFIIHVDTLLLDTKKLE